MSDPTYRMGTCFSYPEKGMTVTVTLYQYTVTVTVTLYQYTVTVTVTLYQYTVTILKILVTDL